jgi:hypothetical protein
VCGNPNLDFDALQQNAKYEGGYHPITPVSGKVIREVLKGSGCRGSRQNG